MLRRIVLATGLTIGLTTGLALALASPAAAEGPVGRFAVEGRGPSGGDAYRGTVEITRTGETYRVVWQIAGQRFTGTGIGNDQFLTVSYRSGNDTGLALYVREKDRWDGTWTWAGGRALGEERWVPR